MKDQYLKALDILDSETTRFWTRFNLFTGLQLIVLAGMAANWEDLIKHKPVALLFVFIAFAFAIFTVLVMWRSHQINVAIFKTILEFENTDESLVLLNTYKKHTKSPFGVIVRYCLVMTSILVVFWMAMVVVLIVG